MRGNLKRRLWISPLLCKQAGRQQDSWGRRSSRPRADSKCWHLAAAAGDVGETCGAESGQEAADFSPKKIWREIDEHVAVVDFADIGDIGEYFAANGDALLDDPGAVFCGKGAANRRIPASLVCFPTKSHARAPVFVARLEDEVFALPADECDGE